jgi:hypothetical protein
MALIGNLETEYGIYATYHHIGTYSWSKDENISILMRCFINQEARDQNKVPIRSLSITLSKDLYPNFFDGGDITFSALYSAVMALPQFSTLVSDEA